MSKNKKVKIVVNGKVVKVVKLAPDETLEVIETAPSAIANAIANSYGHRGAWEGAITKVVMKRKRGEEGMEAVGGVKVSSKDTLELIGTD